MKRTRRKRKQNSDRRIEYKSKAQANIEGAIAPLECAQLMAKRIEKGQLNVLGEIKHQFKPIGATILYLLSESHLSIHTYPERNYCALDLYCCNTKINMVEILEVIYNYFNGNCVIVKKVIDR